MGLTASKIEVLTSQTFSTSQKKICLLKQWQKNAISFKQILNIHVFQTTLGEEPGNQIVENAIFRILHVVFTVCNSQQLQALLAFWQLNKDWQIFWMKQIETNKLVKYIRYYTLLASFNFVWKWHNQKEILCF